MTFDAAATVQLGNGCSATFEKAVGGHARKADAECAAPARRRWDPECSGA
jgi:hypothetical protein